MKSFKCLPMIIFLQVFVALTSQACEWGFTEIEGECYSETQTKYRSFQDAVEGCAQV